MSYNESNLLNITLDADASVAVWTGPPQHRGELAGHSAPVGHLYKFLQVTGRHQCGLATDAKKVVGVLGNKPQRVGDAATVMTLGVLPVRFATGQNPKPGDQVTLDTNGFAKVAGASDRVLGTVISPASPTPAGAIVSVLLSL